MCLNVICTKFLMKCVLNVIWTKFLMKYVSEYCPAQQ
jgi:hypothetical protein